LTQLADVWIEPDLSNFNLLDYHKYKHIADVGYMEALDTIRAWKAQLALQARPPLWLDVQVHASLRRPLHYRLQPPNAEQPSVIETPTTPSDDAVVQDEWSDVDVRLPTRENHINRAEDGTERPRRSRAASQSDIRTLTTAAFSRAA
jgi:hypothetical protein